MVTQQTLGTLSFAQSSEGGKVILWSDGKSDGYVDGCREGRGRATEVLDMIRAHHMPSLLGNVVDAIVARGRYGAVEVGFFQQIAEAAM